MSYSYQTIKKSIEEITFREKGSKFMGYAYLVENEDEASKYLEELWNKFPDATHICYAYRIGIEGEIYKVEDNGEPSGTAGFPIYNQILSKGITNVLVASVRYFGGTKLGVSGLIKAYKYSAQITLDEAEIITRYLKKKIIFHFDYEDQGSVMRNIDKMGAEILSMDFSENCMIEVKIRKDKFEEFMALFEPLYNVKSSY